MPKIPQIRLVTHLPISHRHLHTAPRQASRSRPLRGHAVRFAGLAVHLDPRPLTPLHWHSPLVFVQRRTWIPEHRQTPIAAPIRQERLGTALARRREEL